jgi:hypothetical protein
MKLLCKKEYLLLFVGSANCCYLFILKPEAQGLRIETCQWVATYELSLQIIAAEPLAEKTAVGSPSQSMDGSAALSADSGRRGNGASGLLRGRCRHFSV